MFESFKGANLPAKIIAVSAAGILLGLGFCGAGLSNQNNLSFLVTFGVISFWASILGMIVGFLGWIINAMIGK